MHSDSLDPGTPTTLSTFCEALGFPDPHAILVERARADVKAFRRETARALDVAGFEDSDSRVIGTPDEVADEARAIGRLAMFLNSAEDLAMRHAILKLRALSESLGHPLPPSTEEEQRVVVEIARVAAAVVADALDGAGLGDTAAVIRSISVEDEASAVMAVGASPAGGVRSIAERSARMFLAVDASRLPGARSSGAAIDRARKLVEDLTGCSLSPAPASLAPT